MFIPWNILFEVLNPILDLHNLYTCIYIRIPNLDQFGWLMPSCLITILPMAAMPSHPSPLGGHPRLADCYGPGVVHCQHGAAECFANRVGAGGGQGGWGAVGFPFWEEIPWWIMVVNHGKAAIHHPQWRFTKLGYAPINWGLFYLVHIVIPSIFYCIPNCQVTEDDVSFFPIAIILSLGRLFPCIILKPRKDDLQCLTCFVWLEISKSMSIFL